MIFTTTVAEEQHMERANPDPYLVLLRRELTRAQARLRRCERERDTLRHALNALKERKMAEKDSARSRRVTINK
jgi:uncharacterized protein YlxW (UPF0749 family)